MSDQVELRKAYETVKKTCNDGWASKETGDAILHLVTLSIHFLETKGKLINLVSCVPNKTYVSYKRGKIVARPANTELFVRDKKVVTAMWKQWEKGRLDKSTLAPALYTAALAPCLAMELFDRQNKKGPATYFECLIGHIFAKMLGEEPTKRARIPVAGKSALLTMDFLFVPVNGKSGTHVPVKMSTRERVVQAWAHQRILDSAFGNNTYRGVMVLFSETKMNSHSHEVIEICVPDQWLIYQTLLARFDKIYYFDVPERYRTLANDFPNIFDIKQFGEFFS